MAAKLKEYGENSDITSVDVMFVQESIAKIGSVEATMCRFQSVGEHKLEHLMQIDVMHI